MEYTHYDLGDVRRGQSIEIKLTGNAANIRLMDNTNYIGYTKGAQYRYIGGLANQSLVRLQIPGDGHWHIAIDMQGLRGKVKTSYKLLPAPAGLLGKASAPRADDLAAAYKQHEPNINGAFERPEEDLKEEFIPEYDVFITYANAEKDVIVRPLVKALEAGGMRVWYEGFEIGRGDSLRRRIDKGLGNSRFGVVILSRAMADTKEDFSRKEEIILKSLTGEQLVLLVSHGITDNDLIRYNQSLLNKPMLNTTGYSPESIAGEVMQILKKNELFYK